MVIHKLTNEIVDERLVPRAIKRLGNYINGGTKIDFQCLECEYIWLATPGNILFGTGCPKCTNHLSLTNEIIDQRAAIKGMKRLGNYTNNSTKIDFQCLECNHIWLALPSNLNKRGCPKCGGSSPLTNEIVDKKLINKDIRRLGNYTNNNTPISFQCLICEYIWETTTSVIINLDCGCPKCANVAPLNNDIIDKRLEGRDIKRLGNYSNNRDPIDFICTLENCKYIWAASTSNVLFGTGCPKCAGKMLLTNEMVDLKLIGRNIKRLNDYVNISTAINFQCLECEYIWSVCPTSILNGDHGCPKCGGSLPLNNDIVDERLIGRDIKRLDDYVNNRVHINFQCLKCSNIWDASPSHILHEQTGCPNCNFRKNERLIHNIFIKNDLNFIRNRHINNAIPNECRRILFDFFCNGNIIEYNGEQHYKPVRFGGISIERAEAKFIKQKERDAYLQRICDENKIPIIWIDGREYANSKLEKHIIDTIIPILKAT